MKVIEVAFPSFSHAGEGIFYCHDKSANRTVVQLPATDRFVVSSPITGISTAFVLMCELATTTACARRRYRHTMLATVDAEGRVVVSKEVRERLGLRPGSRIVLREVEGRLEISPATTPVRLVDHEGALVAVADTELPVLTVEQVRDAVEATRR